MDPLQITSRLTLAPDELELSFARSGGPGGQNVNKVESKVLLRFSIRESHSLSEGQRHLILQRLGGRLTGAGDLLIQASNHRERARNLADARERMAALLRGALAPVKKRRKTRPTRASRERRLEGKRRRGQTKRDRRRPIE